MIPMVFRKDYSGAQGNSPMAKQRHTFKCLVRVHGTRD